jgi:hypothetical protein
MSAEVVARQSGQWRVVSVQPVIVLNQSGTTGGKCTPSRHSNTVRAQGKLVIRHNDTFDMNG